jgi:DNA repair protein REV1
MQSCQDSIVSGPPSQPKQLDSRELPTASYVQTADDIIPTLIPVPVDDNDKLSANGVNPSALDQDGPSYAPSSSNLHAVRLMQDPKWRLENTSAGGVSFVEGYFRHSRLHYLSTWKSELKILVKNARSERRFQEQSEDVQLLRDSQSVMASGSLHTDSRSGLCIPRPQKRGDKRMPRRFIMHCDFDSFFVSASLASHPELRGHPVVVCHAHGEDHRSVFNLPNRSTSEIASSSYEARAKGVKNGMR